MKLPSKHAMGPVLCSDCSIDQLLDVIEDHLADPGRGMNINMINAHAYNLCWEDHALRSRMNASDIIAADGMVIVWSARLFGFRIPSRCNMTDAFRAYLARHDARPAAAVLIGCGEETAAAAGAAIERDGSRIRVIKTLAGYAPAGEYGKQIADIGEPPDLILLGMGTPKTEEVSESLRRLFPSSVIWHIGGGTILFLAGEQVEAPVWMRRCGIQWLHRLMREPRRMWRRYLIGNPLFILRILRAALFMRRNNPSG